MNPLFLLLPLAASGMPVLRSPPAQPAAVETIPAGSSWVYKTGTSQIEIRTQGNVTFDPDSEEIFDLHGDGRLRVKEQSEQSATEVRELTASRDGVVWRIDGVKRPFDATGKAWLRGIIKARPATPTTQPPPRR